jgi:hypothetical protein
MHISEANDNSCAEPIDVCAKNKSETTISLLEVIGVLVSARVTGRKSHNLRSLIFVSNQVARPVFFIIVVALPTRHLSGHARS